MMIKFDKLISELRSAIATPDYATIVDLLAQAPAERVGDLTAFYPHTQKVLWILEKIEQGGLDDAALHLEEACRLHACDRLPNGFAPVLGGKLHLAMLAAHKEGEWVASLALDLDGEEPLMLVADDERLFCSRKVEDGKWEQGLDVLWPRLETVIYDVNTKNGLGEARAYVKREVADKIRLPGQQVSPLAHPVVDHDVFKTLYVFPTLTGWKVWVG